MEAETNIVSLDAPVDIKAQAARLENLLPTILRRLFSLQQAPDLAEMPLAQLRICSFLQAGPRSMSAVAEELGMSTSAVTQIADRMERNGLVERVAAQDDRRLKHLHLTAHGERLMQERRNMRTRRAGEALALLPREVRKRLLQDLEQLLQASITTASGIDPLERDPADVAKKVV